MNLAYLELARRNQAVRTIDLAAATATKSNAKTQATNKPGSKSATKPAAKPGGGKNVAAASVAKAGSGSKQKPGASKQQPGKKYFNEEAHPRAKAGASGGIGGQFVPAGQARDARGAAAQQNVRAGEQSSKIQRVPDQAAYAKGLNDGELNELSEYLYSFRSSDPKIVKARTAVANELARRGRNVNDHGGQGRGTRARSTVAPGSTRGGGKKESPINAENISADKVKQLRAAGWRGDPSDGSETLYPPGHPRAKK